MGWKPQLMGVALQDTQSEKLSASVRLVKAESTEILSRADFSQPLWF
jgi:hypothetical protein